MEKKNIGWVGLGKLGLPIAATLAQRHRVLGCDANPALMRRRAYEHREKGPTLGDDFQAWFDKADLSFAPLRQVVEESELVFVAVQTPHGPEYEGITRLPETRADFDYSHLKAAVGEIVEHTRPDQIVVVISTVLPGTMRREILPIVKGKARLVYNPFFIAMGTCVWDFLNPEFVLIGDEDRTDRTGHELETFYQDFYRSIEWPERMSSPAVRRMSFESAELVKTGYNCAISQKIVLANTLMEICHKMPGCHVEDVTSTLKMATHRLVSTAYMNAGTGDSGPCHPRDGIAMSWLARELNLSYDLFGQMMEARERQTGWLVRLLLKQPLPIVILGKSYKPESDLTAGSIGLLIANLLRERGIEFEHVDPHVGTEWADWHCSIDREAPRLFLIATKHRCFAKWQFPKGSIVLDPFRYIDGQESVTVVPVGVGK